MRRRLGLLGFVVSLLGCPGPTTTPRPTPPQEVEPDPETPSATVTDCPATDPFTSLSWVPHTAESVTLIDLRSPALPEALEQLSAGTQDPQRQLPIRVAFALGQWTWQVPLIRNTLSAAGFDPSQLVHVALRDGASAWAWPPSCDLTTATANLERGWGVQLRTTPYGAVATATGDFPYDFLAYGASTYLLVPAGRASTVSQRLAERPRDPSAESLGEHAAKIEPGPLRLVVRTGSLLTPGAPAHAEVPIVRHRIDARGWSTPTAGS